MTGSQRGQAAVVAVGAGMLLLAVAAGVVTAAAAQLAGVRAQRVADLTAVSAARALARVDAGVARSPQRARAALRAAIASVPAADGARIDALTLPDARAGAAGTTVRVVISLPAPLGLRATASARAGLRWDASVAGDERGRGWAAGGGYAGPLVYRDGKPMCPSVAAAYDLMDAAARGSGVTLTVVSGFRSDAEQAVLFARHPDPRWVAPPGRSRHRDSTELDLGPSAAYGWLAANASRFGFVQRYSWEPWHYGYTPGCSTPVAAAPAPRDADQPSASWGDSPRGPTPPPAPGIQLPGWVPAAYRDAVVRAAAREGLAPVLLAALLQAESGFDARAVSPAGAQGIAQFMPATAAGVGLRDPFDASQAIPAAATLLGAHVRRFGSVPLALAAYNAGPGAVERYGGIPPYAETRAYVARILALAGGAASAPGSGAWSTAVVLLPDTAGQAGA